MNNRRTGKIARLPKELRDRVNVLLRDGATYRAIIEMLKDGTAGFVSEQNVTNWKDGGHQDWLKEQERLDDMRFKREFALQLVRDNEGSVVHEAGMHLAASQIYELLTDFDLGALKDNLRENPQEFANIVNALSKLNKGALDLDKFKHHVREKRDAITATLAKAKDAGGLTAETIAEIEGQLKLL